MVLTGRDKEGDSAFKPFHDLFVQRQPWQAAARRYPSAGLKNPSFRHGCHEKTGKIVAPSNILASMHVIAKLG
jgi:hypothetical protein